VVDALLILDWASAPVPRVRWNPTATGDTGNARLTGRAVASLPVRDLAEVPGG
jgi:hypothetical protein